VQRAKASVGSSASCGIEPARFRYCFQETPAINQRLMNQQTVTKERGLTPMISRMSQRIDFMLHGVFVSLSLLSALMWLAPEVQSQTNNCAKTCDRQSCIASAKGEVYFYYYYDLAVIPAFTQRTDTPQTGFPQTKKPLQYKSASAGAWCTNHNPLVSEYIKSDYCMPSGDWIPDKQNTQCGGT
jgi:hypothetical protein